MFSKVLILILVCLVNVNTLEIKDPTDDYDYFEEKVDTTTLVTTKLESDTTATIKSTITSATTKNINKILKEIISVTSATTNAVSLTNDDFDSDLNLPTKEKIVDKRNQLNEINNSGVFISSSFNLIIFLIFLVII